jgi:flagellar motility protein MotE (MotC chaperone)
MAEKRLTKKEAQELYDDLQKAVGTMMAKGQSTYSKRQSSPTGVSATTPRSTATPSSTPPRPTSPSSVSSGASARKGRNRISGEGIAFAFLGIFCCGKIALSALEVSGIASVEPAQAAIVLPPKGPQWSKEEVKVLTALDNRRVELEERAARIEQRETEATARDRDLAVRITELKELSEKLKIEREKGDKQRNAQLDQLANVYGSMNPPEAAHLLEQLDIHVALSLVERLPEKRMGQILALMNAQRALELTNLLSKRPL